MVLPLSFMCFMGYYLSDVHYKCWSTFVLPCCLLCLPIITRAQTNEPHVLLVQYLLRLYGKDSCTPIMHMSLHFMDCMLDFGLFFALWCFPFELYNRILGGFINSWSKPEKQMFIKFLGIQQAYIRGIISLPF